MSNHLSNAFDAIGNGISKVARSAGREVNRALDEGVEHINEDFDSISKAIDEGGLLGGALQAADVFSPGHQFANTLDMWNVIPEDPALKELVSAGANLWTTGPFSLLAIKDIADSIGAIRDANAPSGPMAPSQGAEHPSMAPLPSRGFPDLASRAPVSGASDVIIEVSVGGYTSRPGGTCGGGLAMEGSGSVNDKLQDALDRFRKGLHGKRDGTGREEGELDREIAKILANPNLMFEDMVFLLMRAFIKDTRREVKELTKDLRGTRELDQASRDDKHNAIKGAQADLIKARQSGDPAKIEAASNKVANLQSELQMEVGDRSESRADKFEELKQVMQRLSEMEQALSNVLNTMHESSMAAIRNIR